MITIQDTVKKFHSKEATEQAIKELVEYHVTEALKAASENAEAIDSWNTGFSGNSASVNKQSILTAYSLNLIE